MSTQQAEIAKQTKEETVIQVRMAERAEEQSKSVLVFTIITTVFLPLSFFTSVWPPVDPEIYRFTIIWSHLLMDRIYPVVLWHGRHQCWY